MNEFVSRRTVEADTMVSTLGEILTSHAETQAQPKSARS